MSTSVLLTGASGFIALHIIDVLLSKNYTVIGTVRSQDKAEKITKQFKELYPDGKLSFELVSDIASEGAFDDALKNHPEITAVLHTASPFSFGLGKPLEEAYLIPATQGTKNILEAITKYAPQVKRVVVTSSFASILNVDKTGDKSFIHTEETWNPITWEHVNGSEVAAYVASKKLAEVLAREFVANEKPNFTLTTVTPPYVLGPQKFDDVLKNPTLNTSAEFVNAVLKISADDKDNHPDPNGLLVDVRDVALLHVLPLENEALASKRLFAVSAPFSAQTLLNSVHRSFPELEGVVGKGQPEGAEEYIAQHQSFYDTSKTKELTGIKEWISVDKTVKDSVTQILNYNKAHK